MEKGDAEGQDVEEYIKNFRTRIWWEEVKCREEWGRIVRKGQSPSTAVTSKKVSKGLGRVV